MKKLVVSSLVVGIGLVASSWGIPEHNSPSAEVSPVQPLRPDKVLRAGEWQLHITYRAKGSKSEGQHGVLFYRGEPVHGSRVGEERDTALGRMKYYGEKQGLPWLSTGWNYADSSKIRHSWQDSSD